MPQINGRLRQKIDTEINWNKATNFIPLDGEIIVYKADENYSYARIKIGDGETTVGSLKFINEEITESKIDEICSSTIT